MKALHNILQSLIKPVETITGILWYRTRKHLSATLFSLFFAFAIAGLLCFVIGEIYPGFKSYYKKLPFYPDSRPQKYSFYSGENGGVYSAIGRSVTNNKTIAGKPGISTSEKIGIFRNLDTLRNYATGGGFDNFMKVSTEKNSFGLVQEAVINLQDEQLRKGIRMETPLFMERLHIFYRKDLFSKFMQDDQVQLSANTDSRVLKCITQSVRNIQVGIVGSCTRIIASDVMDLLERQIAENPTTKHLRHKYKLYEYPFSTAMKWMHQYKAQDFNKAGADSIIDIMFLMAADPTNNITRILDGGKYKMMSVHPSFMGLLNREFKLNLQVADFYKKYNCSESISTVGTLSFLIASGDIQANDVKRILRRIHRSTMTIHRSLITLPPGCNDQCYSGNNDGCKYILPLAEFGFFKRIQDEGIVSGREQAKAMIPFVIAMISLFFPVLKSVSWFKSTWCGWHYNKKIDQLLINKSINPEKELQKLLVSITDLYGDSELSEAHYNALTKRIEIHLPDKKSHVYKEATKKKSQFQQSSYKMAN